MSETHQKQPSKQQQRSQKPIIGQLKQQSIKSKSIHKGTDSKQQLSQRNKNQSPKKSEMSMNKKQSQQMSQREWSAAYQNQDFNLQIHHEVKRDKTQKQSNKQLNQKVESSKKIEENCVYWETAYIDQKFYLSDPTSLAKLRQLENQIEIQRQKLNQIQTTQKLDKSYLSQRGMDQDDVHNNKLECLTEINESKLLQRKKNAEQDLLCLQQKYQAKIQQMKKKKSILKKQIGCGTNDKNLQINEQQILKQAKQLPKSTKNIAQNQNVNKKQASNIQNNSNKNNMIQNVEKDSPSKVKSQIKNIQKSSKGIQKNEVQKQKSTVKKPSNQQKSKKSNAIQKSYVQQKSNLIKIQKQVSNNQNLKAKSEILEDNNQPNLKPNNLQVAKSNKKDTNSIRQVEKSDKKVMLNLPNSNEKQRSYKQSQKKQTNKQESNKQFLAQNDNKSHKNQKELSIKQQSNKQKSIKKSQKIASKQISIQKQASPKIQPSQKASKRQKKHQQHQQHINKQVNKNQVISNAGANQQLLKGQSKKQMIKEKSQRSLNKQENIQKQQKSIYNSKKNDQEKSKKSKKQISKSNKMPEDITEKQSDNLNPPQIKIHEASFRKTDKSVQWQQIEPSVSKFQIQKSSKQQFKQISQKANTKQIIQKSQKSNKSHQKSAIKQPILVKNSQNSIVQQNKLAQSKISSIKNSPHSQKNQISQINNKSLIQKTQKQISINGKQVSQKKSFKQQQKLKESNIHSSPEQNKQQYQKSEAQEKSEMKSQSANLSESQLTSQKKKTSFKIHSRQNSVKSKKSSSQKPSVQKKNSHSQYFNNNFQEKHSQYGKSVSDAKINKQQFQKLHQQIQQLQEKLKKVQQKQEQMIKFQNNPSKVMSQLQASQAGSGSEPVSPLGKFNLTSRLKLQAKLSLQGSTVQFNTYQQKTKRTAQQNQKLQKLRLQQQIGRLKKIIRDMQMQKIKSIQYDQNQSFSKVQLRKPSILDPQQNNYQSRASQKWKESLNSDMLQTKRNEWNIQTMNKDVKYQTGKIIKNSPQKYHIDSPKKYNRINAEKSRQFSQIAKDDERGQAPLPLRKKAQSVHGGKSRDLTKSELINKFQQNDKNFHQFLEASRLVVQEPESLIDPVNRSVPQDFQQKDVAKLIPSQAHNSPSDEKKSVKRNFSQLIEKLKNQNPQDQIITPQEIKVGNIHMPNLPEAPNLNTNQDDLLEIAKKTYSLFGVKIDQDQNQLCMKKYKNCVMFSFGNNQQQTILWHYSGKFYYGGWKNLNDQGEGEKIGQGIQYIPGKHLYQGQFMAGKKNGNGIVKMANGNIYDGQWIDGTKNGRGVYFQASTGTYYSGQWKDGKRDGYGILKFSNNEFYEGTFSKSIKHGYGVQKFGNNDYYKGQYQKGKFHGKGKYSWANGSSYEGDFVQGFRHGQGSWKSSRNAGDIYIGGYQNDKKCGYGRYVWSNGCIYEGYFKNDLKNGKGRLVYQDGKQIKGSWEDGNLVSSDQQSRKVQNHEQQPLRRSIRASSLKNNPNPISSPYRRPAN